jgi:hypothetical protein
MNNNSFKALFQVLSSEQQILMRTDQKAFTLLSILGVFMVFFIIHFLKIQINWFTFILVFVYFIAAFMAIVYLVLVIVPRIREDKVKEDNPDINATFFGGISQFSTAEDYANYLAEISANETKTYNMFATQVFALGKINNYKNKNLKQAILFFAVAIMSELLIIMSMAWGRALPFLFPG